MHVRGYEENAGRSDVIFPLPEAARISQASAVSFLDIEKELVRMKEQFDNHSLKVFVLSGTNNNWEISSM